LPRDNSFSGRSGRSDCSTGHNAFRVAGSASSLKKERSFSFLIDAATGGKQTMAGTLLVRHPPWRQLLIVSLVAPIVITLAVLAFTWPASRTAPRDLPVGIVGTGEAGQHLVEGLTRRSPGAFDLHLYADDAAARAAIKDRTVYGAFEPAPAKLTLLTASAEGPAVDQLLTTVAAQLQGAPVATVDVVPSSPDDPRSAVFTGLMSPLVLGGEILAVIVAVLVAFRPAWRQLLALTIVSAGTALGVFLVAQAGLDALPGDHLATWGALALTLFALCATTAGLAAMVGPAGVALGAALMVFVGNPFSGITSAPELLPKAIGRLGQLLPPGAGSNLVRSTAYFDGNGAALHVVVLAAWSVLGVLLVLEGHRRARRRPEARHREHLFAASPLHEALERDARPAGEPIELTFRSADGVPFPR
jgi:hypothetical protein